MTETKNTPIKKVVWISRDENGTFFCTVKGDEDSINRYLSVENMKSERAKMMWMHLEELEPGVWPQIGDMTEKWDPIRERIVDAIAKKTGPSFWTEHPSLKGVK